MHFQLIFYLTAGPDKSKGIIGLHAFTGCDTVSFFYTIGKPKAVSPLHAYYGSAEAFIELSVDQIDSAKPTLINFVIKLYSP